VVDELKPLLRGRLHEAAFFASIPAGIALIVAARGVAAQVAAAIYAVSLTALYGASASYHRLRVQASTRAKLRRLDHSMIYVLIAGSYTPFVLLTFGVVWSAVLLSVVWGGAVAGIVVKVVRFEQWSKFGFALYLVLGWVIVLAGPTILRVLSINQLALLAAGGVIYTVGAIGVGTRWPNPAPRVFGYHEVWHSMVVLASVCHYAAIFSLVNG
jgi:hemolysin III